MNYQQLATLIVEMNTKLDILKKLEERMDKHDEKLDKLLTDRESSTAGENSTPLRNNYRDNTDNQPNRSNTQTPSHRNDIKDKRMGQQKQRPEFPKVTSTIKYYKCQDYEHVAANYPSSFMIVINDGVSIEAPKSDSTISLKVTYVVKEFTVTRLFPFPALLSTPPLLPISTVVTCLVINPFLLN